MSIKRLFGLTVDVQSAGGAVEVGSVYADRAAISSAAPAPAAAGAGAAAAAAGQRHAAAARGATTPGTSASQAMAAGSSCSSGGLHISHIACLKGEARLESGGGPLEVDGLEGNAALLSSGGNIKVSLLAVAVGNICGQHTNWYCCQPSLPATSIDIQVHWHDYAVLQTASLDFCATNHIVPLCLLQVHLHEHAGLVYVDSDGGAVTAWLSPSGPPLGLQVKAAGGVSLDPALQVQQGLVTWIQHAEEAV